MVAEASAREVRYDLALALDRVAWCEERLGFEPDEWQRDLLNSGSKRILLNCSRQSGKSTCAALLSLHTAIYKAGSLSIIAAPSERQSKELMTKVTNYATRLGLGLTRNPKDAVRKMSVELPTGSRIEALPGTERSIRGFSKVELLVLDEAARIDDSLYHAVRPMLSVSQGSLIMLSTPWGRRGVFFEEFVEGGPEWERFEIPASAVPRISSEFLEEERRSLPARVYRQEYENSFEDVEDQLFSYEDIKASVDEEILPILIPGALGGDV